MDIKIGTKFKHNLFKLYVGTIYNICDQTAWYSWAKIGKTSKSNAVKESISLEKIKRFFSDGDWVLITDTTDKNYNQTVTIDNGLNICSCELDIIMGVSAEENN